MPVSPKNGGMTSSKTRNVCGIVIEFLPNFGSGSMKWNLGAHIGQNEEGWIQADQVRDHWRPFFLPGEERGAYLSGEPRMMTLHLPSSPRIEHRELYAAGAKAVARSCCRIYSFLSSARAGTLPHNGRTLTDELSIFSFYNYANRSVTDMVGPHGDLLDEFPYLGLRTNLLKQL